MLLNTYCRLRSMVVSRKGQGLVEYVILVTVLAVGLISVVTIFRDQIKNMFDSIVNRLRRTN